jgi:prepilin-type N-terminal cleavage/methylation domain-containing protein
MRRLGENILKFIKGQRGMTLLEVLVSVGILASIGMAVLFAMDTNSRASRTLDEQVIGTNLATSYIEAISQLPYDNNSPNEYSNAGDNITIPTQYEVVIDCDYSSDATNWADNYSSPDQTLQRISISVSREGGKPVLSICTFRTEF